MKVDTMRRIDRYAGVPLCAVATVLLWFWNRLPWRSPGPVQRILFAELSEMGTTVLASPAMRKAGQELRAELFFVIFRRNVSSLHLLRSIPPSNIFTIRDTSLFHLAFDTLAFLVWTRRKRIDTMVDLELFSRFTALLTGFSGASRRVGFYRFHNEGLYRGEMLSHRVAYNPHIHIAKNFIALVDALLAPAPEVPYSKTVIGDDQIAPPAILPSDTARADMLGLVRARVPFNPGVQRLVLINPNASELLPHRRWMKERYSELIRRILARYHDVVVVVTGSPAEQQEADMLASIGSPRCFSLAGLTKLEDLPALYSLASVMVSNDSGPSHFSAATGLSTIVLFGPEIPRLYQPLGNSRAIYAGLACSPCVSASNHRKTACKDNVCMRAISVDEVFNVVSDVLDGRGHLRQAVS